MAALDLTMLDRYGLHPRAALRIQQAIAGKRASVTIQGLDGTSAPADASSLIALVSAGIGFGDRIRVTATGADADDALAAVGDLIAAGVCHP